MEEIGGYFAKLSLITDGASFDKGKDALDSIGPAADNAAKAVQKLEALYGGFSKQGHIYVPSGSVQSAANEGDEAPKENERKQKAVTAASTLFVLKEVVGAAKKIITAIDKLVGASVQQTQASTVSAVRSGFTTAALNKWQSALGTMGVNFDAFTSAVTGVETAFNRLKVGDASGFAAIAQPLAILAQASGKANVDPTALMGMDNESRTKAIIDAALSMTDTKQARTLLEQIYGDVGGALYAAARAPGRNLTSAEGILGMAGATTPAPTAESVKAADEYKRAAQNLEVYLKQLGMGITEGMQPYLAIINKQLGTGKSLSGMEDIGRVLGALLGMLLVPLSTIVDGILEIVDFTRNIGSKFHLGTKAPGLSSGVSTEDLAARLAETATSMPGPSVNTPQPGAGIVINVTVTGTGDPKVYGQAVGDAVVDRLKSAPGAGPAVKPYLQ